MRRLRPLGDENHDPLQGVANLFDLGIVFALAFLLSLLSYLGLPRLPKRRGPLSHGSVQERVLKDAVHLKHYRVSQEKLRGEGTRLGTAYRLKSGEVVYVPEK